MLLLTSLVVSLLGSLCSAEYYHVIGEDFNDYIEDSGFHVETYANISAYGIPPPPGSNSAVYLTDYTMTTQSHIIHLPSTQIVTFQFTFYCDDSLSELEIRISYPYEGEDIVLCGLNSAIERPGKWVTETFTRECYSTCTYISLWLYGTSIEIGNIVGLHSITINTKDSTFAPTETTQSTFTPTTTKKTSIECTTGMTLVGDEYFKWFTDRLYTWEEARQKCYSDGMMIMAEPEDPNTVGGYLYDNYPSHAFQLGARDDADGVFHWNNTGAVIPSSSPYWYPGYGPGEDCHEQGDCCLMIYGDVNPFLASPCNWDHCALCQCV